MRVVNPLNRCSALAAARRRYAASVRRPAVYFTTEALRFGGDVCPSDIETRDLVAKEGTYPTVFVLPVDQITETPVDPTPGDTVDPSPPGYYPPGYFPDF